MSFLTEIYRKIKRRNFNVNSDEMERVHNIIKSMPEGVDVIVIRKYFLGINYKNKVMFKCKICGQEIHPKIGINGYISWQCPNNCKINGK